MSSIADAPHSVPLWAPIESTGSEPLNADLQVEVLVIGAGIAGLTSAYLLARAGKQVHVVEARALGGTMSQRTTAHLVTALDDRIHQLERWHGQKNARLAVEGHAAAIEQIETLVNTLGIDCDFHWLTGYLVSAQGAAGESSLRQEQEAAQRAGLEVDWLAGIPVGEGFGGPALGFARQAQFNIDQYLTGLLKALQGLGVRISAQTPVRDLHVSRLGRGQVRVTTATGQVISAQQVVVATNAPINSRFELPLKQEAYLSYVIAAQWPQSQQAPFLLWDDQSAYHYVRLVRSQPDGPWDTLLVGGEDHKVGQAQDPQARYQALEDWMREHFPQAGAVTHRWAGEVLEPVDGLGFMGRSPDVRQRRRVWVISGDSGNGMTHGTLGAMIVTDQILGQNNRYAAVFDPARRNPRAALQMLKAGLNVQWQYRDLVTAGQVSSEADIPPGSGAVLRQGIHKIAVYRDEEGQVHKCSAVCPHLAAVVRWNPDDRSWDCPCHGSRFDAQGRVLQGPALTDLSPWTE